MKQCIPRILLVEDDPVSRAYLGAALEALPAIVDPAATAGDALRTAASHGAHAVWLVDAHLPDADGAMLLARLRLLGPGTPALAHTASREPCEIDALLACGFDRVLCKPIAAVALRAAVRDALQRAPRPASAIAEARVVVDWDDHAALAALHDDRDNVAAMRRLFRGELPAQHAAVVAALGVGDRFAAAEVLHRMRAGCAFVGARRLDAAVQALQLEPCSPGALCAFSLAVAALLRRG